MKLLFKVTDAVKVLLMSGRGLSPLWKKGGSIAATMILRNCRHYIPMVKTVLDVGANKGQFALATTHFYPGANIYAFEPVPAVYKQLQQNTRKIAQLHTYNFALGSTSGTIGFYENAYSHASSALQVSALQQTLMPRTASTSVIHVPVKRLDDIRHQLLLESPVLLKLDVQGYEKEVLKGAAGSLPYVDYLLFETSFVQLYEEEPLFNEMNAYVQELGFELIGPVGFLQSSSLQILQMDLLYKRKQDSL